MELIIEDNDIKPLVWWKYLLIYIFTFLLTITGIIYTILQEHEDKSFFLEKGISIMIIAIIYYLNGRILVKIFKLRINYTRKINHFTIWVLPFIFDFIFDLNDTLLASLWNVIFAIIGFVLLTIPIRRKFGCIQTVYSSLDRPEDRPNTLLWLTLQNFLTGISLVPFFILWKYWDNVDNYKFIPLFIATFGDGFAEIIGIRFGKHKYETYAIFTNKKYTRSYEGSFCVFLTALIMIFAFNYNFTTLEFILNGILIPILTTLAEAKAPHTMDNPFIIIVSSGILSLSHYLSL